MTDVDQHKIVGRLIHQRETVLPRSDQSLLKHVNGNLCIRACMCGVQVSLFYLKKMAVFWPIFCCLDLGKPNKNQLQTIYLRNSVFQYFKKMAACNIDDNLNVWLRNMENLLKIQVPCTFSGKKICNLSERENRDIIVFCLLNGERRGVITNHKLSRYWLLLFITKQVTL